MDNVLLDRWLADRSALIVKLVEAGSAACGKAAASAAGARLGAFLDHLVDYISAAHFDRFARLAEHAGAARAIERCYPLVARTTARLIACHDILADRQAGLTGEQASELLARIGMTLEDHFVLEDHVLRAAAGDLRRAA
jgi:regulator of sigma D